MRVREKRTPRKVSVRHFGLDAAGRPFSDSVFTVDISSSGACLEGVWRALRVADIVGIQCGNMKARFKIAWVGEPNTARHGRVGLISLEKNKYLWSAAPPEEAPSPQPAEPATAPPTSVGAAPRRAPETLASRLESLTRELTDLNTRLRAEEIAPEVVRALYSALNEVRLTIWGRLRLQQQSGGRDDAFEAVTFERVRVATTLAHNVAMDIDAFDVTETTPGIEDLRSAVKMLHARLMKLLGKSDG
jgi:hypothetical protein